MCWGEGLCGGVAHGLIPRRAGPHFARERGALLKYRGSGWLDDVAA